MGEADFQSQVLDMLVDLKGEVGAVKGDIVALKAGNAERCKTRGDTLDDHEDRIRKLEEHKTFGAGKMTGIAATAGIGGAGLLKLGAWLFGAR